MQAEIVPMSRFCPHQGSLGGIPACERVLVMNQLRLGGYRSIRQGLRELAYDIQGMLELGGVATRTGST